MESQLINNISAIEEDEEILIRGHEKKKKGLLIMKLLPADHDDKRPWADLPSDVLNYIFSQLSDFDCIRFRLTCIEWQLAVNNNISPSISPWIIKLQHYLLTLFPCWRMFFSEPESHGVFDFLHPITNETYTLHIPELADCTFHCSRYGWLLMSRDRETTYTHYSFFFYNPLIPNSTINLPDLAAEYNPSSMSMSFTAPPTSPDCLVFANKSHLKKYYTCRRGEDHWRRSTNNNMLMPLKEFACTPVFYRGVFYQLDREGRLVTLDTNKEHVSVLPKPTRPNIPYTVSHYKKYIAECDGEFVSVFMDSTLDYPVHVFKLDWSEMEWVTMKSLGNRTMFISEMAGCLLVPAAKTIFQNKIYFPNFRYKKQYYYGCRSCPTTKKDRECVFYSLETCKFHAFGRDFSSKNLCGTSRLLNSVWIEPNLTITQDEVEDNWFNILNPLQLR